METRDLKSSSAGGSDKALGRSNEILFNDVEYDRKFRALQAYLPFVDNLLLQSSGKIASDRLQSLQTMLKETNTKMKYDVMAKCESVLQSLMKKMEAAKNMKSNDSIPRTSAAQKYAVTQPVQPRVATATVTTIVPGVCENQKQQVTDMDKSSVYQTNGHLDHQTKHFAVSKEKCIPQTSESSCQSLSSEELADKMSKMDPENRSMLLTLKLAAARTARNAETTQKVSKRVPITWDDTSSMPSRMSETDTLKLAAARAARFAEPPQLPDNQRSHPTKDDLKEPKELTATLQKCSDVSTLKLAAARTSKQRDSLSTGSDVSTNVSGQKECSSLEMSRNKLKKLISPDSKVIGEDHASPPRFSDSKFDLDSPRNDWDFQAAPESCSHWNPSPPAEDSTSLSADGDSGSNAAAALKSPIDSEPDQAASHANNGNTTCARSVHGSSPIGSYYSPIHGLVQRRISTGPESPLSPDESGHNAVEAKRRLRDKLSQEIHMVHRVGTSKGGSLRGLAAKDGKVLPSTKDDKKAGCDGAKRSEKIVEIDMFSKEVTTLGKNTAPEHAKESTKVLKGLYAPRYKSSQENSSAKCGIVSSEQKPTSRSSIDASRLMKSPPCDSGLKKSTARAESRPATGNEKSFETDSVDSADAHSRILSTMTAEELKRAVHMNVRNLPSPPAIPALVLESGKSVPISHQEKVILNPAFNNAPPLIEPGFFSKSDVDLRLQDPNGFHRSNSDFALQQKNIPQNVNNRDPRATYVSRFDRDTPMSPDGDSSHEQSHINGPRHITYHFNDADGWHGSNSSGNRPHINLGGCLPGASAAEECFRNQYPQNREAQWMNGGHLQTPYNQRDPHVAHGEERNFQHPLGDRRALQMSRDDERNHRMPGDNRDFRELPFHARNFQQSMGNQSVPQIQKEHGRNANQFPMGDTRFKGPNFYSGQSQRLGGDPRFMQDTERNMSNLQRDNRFHGTQFAGVRSNPVFDQRGIVGQDQGRMAGNSHHMHGANHQGRNACGPAFNSHEQQIQHVQGRNMVHQPFVRNQDFPMAPNQCPKPNLLTNEGENHRLTSAPLAPPLILEVPSVQGPSRDPRNFPKPPRPETNKTDQFHWKHPSLSTPAAASSPRQAHGSQSAPIPTLSPTNIEKDRPVHGPLSPLPSAAPHADQILADHDCIPFTPPRILDPRTANRTQGEHTAPPFQGANDDVPYKGTLSKSQKSQPLAVGNSQRKQRNSWLDSSRRRNGKDSSRRNSWEAEEARRREDKRKSMELSQSHKRHKDKDASSMQKLGSKDELVSPLNSLYGSTIIQKTGVGYGIQKFKIPKIKRPSPPKQLEPEVSATVESLGASNVSVPEPPVILPADQAPLEQKGEEKSGTEQKLTGPKSIEQTLEAQKPEDQPPVEPIPVEQPATTESKVEKPNIEPLPLPAPLIVEAFMQQSNINVDVNQLLENLKLLGTLKPNQLKKFQNILMNSSSSDDSDVDTNSTTKKKKNKLKTSKKKVSEELNKSVEDAEIQETKPIGPADSDPPSKSVAESEESKAEVSEVKKEEVPARKLRGRKPGPLGAKKKKQEMNCEAPENSIDLDSSAETTPTPRMTRNKRRNSLEILQADIKDMYISEGVLSASGRRICTMLKKEVAITEAAKELPKNLMESLAESESDSQASVSKKKTPTNSRKGIVKKAKERITSASKRSGKHLKGVSRSICSSDGDDVSDVDVPLSEPAVNRALESDDDRNEPMQDQETITETQRNMTKPRKKKVGKRGKNLKEKNLSIPVTSSASDDDEDFAQPAKDKRKKIQNKTSKSSLILSDVECSLNEKTSKIQENEDCDSSPVAKKKVAKAQRLCDSSDSCVESVTQSINSTTSEDVEVTKTTKISASDKSIATTSFPVNSSVNLSAYVKLQKMSASSLTPSPSFGSSDESSDILPLTALIEPKSRQVARRGRQGKRLRSRRSHQMLSSEDRSSAEFDSSIPLEGFPKANASGRSDDAYLGESITDIIDRLSKDDDDDSKRGEVDDTPDEGSVGTKESVSGTKGQKKKRKSNWSLGVIKKKRQIKSASPEAVNSEGTKNVDSSLYDCDVENAPENSPLNESNEGVPESENIGSIPKETEEAPACGDSDSGKAVAVSSFSQEVDLVPAAADLADKDTPDQKHVECPVDEKDASHTELIRNVDKDYYIRHNFKSRKYLCKLCPWSGNTIVSHYTSTHPDNETFISRLSKDAAEQCIAESIEKGYVSAEDPEVESEKPARRKTQTFTCRMCYCTCTNYSQFYDHCCAHTGEYRYKCSQCSSLMAGKSNVGSHYQYHHKELKSCKDKCTELFPMPPPKANGAFAYICSLCNFVQMCKSNVEKHVNVHHSEECDTVKIVYFNMHADTDKKQISSRKPNKKVSDAALDDSLDAGTEIKHESENGNSAKVDGEDHTQVVDLAAFLLTDQEILGQSDTDLDPITKDVIDDPNTLSFISKMMPDDQNSLIDDLIRRTENRNEGKDNSAPNQINPAMSDGILDSQSSESLLIDELSQDSCLSDSTLTDDVPLSEPVTGTSDLMDDIIKRLEVSTAADVTGNLNVSKQLSEKAKIDIIPHLQQENFVGPFEVRNLDDLPVYGCNVDCCNFSAVNAESFISHLKYNHLEEAWDGVCQTCGTLVIVGDVADLMTAFLHLLKCHLNSTGVDCDEAQQQISVYEQTTSHQDPLAFGVSSEDTPFIRLQTRRLSSRNFSVLKGSDEDDDDSMNMCVIENVVSLAPVTPTTYNDVQHEPPPLPPVIANPTHLSSPAENSNKGWVSDRPTKVIPALWQIPKSMRSVPKLAKLVEAPVTVPTAVQNLTPKALSKQQASLFDGGNSLAKQGSKVQLRASVQCLQAKVENEKDSSAYEQMLEPAKLRHLFKCMARSCSYSTNNPFDFGRHRAVHQVDKNEYCAYCMKTFALDKNRELVAHIQLEHGHCTFQCAYCFYRAVCPSYVLVHQNLSHTNKSISMLQCLGSAKAHQPASTLSEVIPKYVCSQSDCGKTYLLTEQFILHLHEAHAQIHNYSCHLCDTVCFDSRNFIAHYRMHSLHLYQCRYCVHGTSNEEAMHHHLCNVHPGQSPKVVMREANHVRPNEPVTLDDLTIVDLGEKTAVEDSLIIKLSMTEMVDEVDEGEESESDNVVSEPSIKPESVGEPIPQGTAPEESVKAEEIPGKQSDAPICICLDSDDESSCIDLTSSADDRSVRSLRSSPRKSTPEGETGERRARPEKRPLPAKEEVVAKPRPTTSFEFGAITLEDLNETGLSGEKLFRCGFSTCESVCDSVEELREHLMVCDHSRNSHGLFCPHCQRSMKNLAAFCDHLRSHSTCRYGCGLCLFRATAAKPVQSHLRSRHRITTTKCIPLNPLKADPENDLFVVGPLRPDKRKNHLVSQIQSPDKKSRPKYVYQPDEGHLLPIQAIYPFIVTCATCSFTTKVRKNMERHLTLHKTDFLVPSQNPVNAVPCLEAKEMMFDKMTNLAASSNLKAPDATNLYLTPEDVARLPKFVPEQQRYRCGVQNCTYNSCDENMLIHHLRALHRDEEYYNCPHCPPSELVDENGEMMSRIVIEKLSLHLKMHDNRLYKCGYCFYFDHRRHIVERHVTEKHTDYKMHVNVVREPFGEGTPVVSAKPAEKEPTKELAPRFAWKCSRCLFESVTRPEMVNHSESEHGKKLQYECGLCHSRFQSKQSFDQHCGFKHPGLKEQLLFNFFKVENAGVAVVEAAFDTRPLWSRDGSSVKHIRGILFEDEFAEPPKDVPEPEIPTLPTEEPVIKEAMFLCSICKTYETKIKADMKIHLYKELKYFRYQCTFCDKKVFSLTAGKKHMSRAHASTDTSTALTLFEKELETEQKVEEILAAQEDLMQLDNPSKLTKPARSHKSKSQAARTKEAPVARAKIDEPTTLPSRASAIGAKEGPAAPGTEGKAVRVKDASKDANDSDVSVDVDDNDKSATVSKATQQQQPLTKTFECRECGQLFHTVRGLKVHIRLSHLSQGKWKCKTCQLTHTSRNYIKQHCKSAHPNSTIDPPFGINAERSLPSASRTVDYWQSVWGIKTKASKPAAVDNASGDLATPSENFKCQHCDASFMAIGHLKRHEKRHLVQKPYRCGHCSFEAVSDLVVRHHSEKSHPRIQPLVELLDLPEQQDIVPVYSRQKRKQNLKRKKAFDCVDKPPPAKQPRLDMEVIELDDDDGDDVVPVIAPRAPVSGTPALVSLAPASVSASLPLVSAIMPDDELQNFKHFKCFYCPLRADTRGLVHEHWLREHKSPRFADDGNIYPNTGVSFHLETIHRPLVEFPCQDCDESFGSRSALRIHAESAHSILRNIECPKCNFKSAYPATMGEHLRVHSFTVKCTLCENAQHLSKTNAVIHWQVAHPDNPLKADSFMLNLDSYKSLWTLGKISARVVKHSNVAKKSTSKMLCQGDFYARKSTGNAPWRRSNLIHLKKARPSTVDISKISIKVKIGLAEVDMRVDTYAKFHNINPVVLLHRCETDS